LPGIVVDRRLSWRDRTIAILHLGACTYGVLMGLTIAIWLLDAALGTITYLIVVPLAIFDFLQGAAGAVGLAVASRTLFRAIGVKRETEGFFPTVHVALRTVGLHGYAGFMTARGVFEGARGRHSLFGRTPKRGAGLDADDAKSASMPL